jgi:hypothetical protein
MRGVYVKGIRGLILFLKIERKPKVSSFAKLKCTPLRSGFAKFTFPFLSSQVRKASRPSEKQFW